MIAILICFFLVLLADIFVASASTNSINTEETYHDHKSANIMDIQSLIDEANPFDTIILPPGIYNQTLIISCPLTLTGISPSTTVLQVHSPMNQAAITIQSEQVTIRNISIINSGKGLYTTGIRALANNTSIESCNIHHTPVGIALWSSYNTISNCSFLHCSDEGIVLLNTSFSPCGYNTIMDCSFLYNCDAIELQQSSHNTITNCTMKYHTHSGIDAIKNNNNHNVITKCTISDNQVHGIYLSHSSYNIIASCSLENNVDGDIIQTPKTTNTVLYKIPSVNESDILSQSPTTPPQSWPNLIKQKIQHMRLLLITCLQLS
jgi:nitrous oxidase accessory protein